MHRIRPIIQTVYDRGIRPHLPRKNTICVQNGVAVRGVTRLLDLTRVFPEYEAELIDGIQSTVSIGDNVVVIGGGNGVSTVVAERLVNTDGSVRVYEGSLDQFNMITDTLSLNKVNSDVQVEHTIVGEYNDFSKAKYGVSEAPKTMGAADISSCDVLVLDCEGAEIDILEDLQIRPRAIVVETHGFLDAPKETVKELLASLDYQVINEAVEKKDKGIHILTAEHATN